jgi:endo-1,4-beta-xylanase
MTTKTEIPFGEKIGYSLGDGSANLTSGYRKNWLNEEKITYKYKNMKWKLINRYCVFISCILSVVSCHSFAQQPALKDAYKGKFYIGVALSREQFLGFNTKAEEVAKTQFNAIVAENCMKSMYLQPEEGKFFFDDADRFVEFGEKNRMYITGHTLIWHSQTPRWFFRDENGNDVSREVLIERMKKHIHTVVGRYKGKIKGWDVVNEAILDNGEWRDSKFYQIIGEDFIWAPISPKPPTIRKK